MVHFICLNVLRIKGDLSSMFAFSPYVIPPSFIPTPLHLLLRCPLFATLSLAISPYLPVSPSPSYLYCYLPLFYHLLIYYHCLLAFSLYCLFAHHLLTCLFAHLLIIHLLICQFANLLIFLFTHLLICHLPFSLIP